MVVPAVAGGVLDGMVDVDDDCAYANAPPARTVLSAIELIVSNFVELIDFSLIGVVFPSLSDGGRWGRAAAGTHDFESAISPENMSICTRPLRKSFPLSG